MASHLLLIPSQSDSLIATLWKNGDGSCYSPKTGFGSRSGWPLIAIRSNMNALRTPWPTPGTAPSRGPIDDPEASLAQFDSNKLWALIGRTPSIRPSLVCAAREGLLIAECSPLLFPYTATPRMTTVSTNVQPQLARDLGVTHATAIVVGTIIGSGIFLVPSEMMQAVGSAKLVYLAWLVGGLLS